MALIVVEGFDFAFDPDACSHCGAKCCRGESGNIWIARQDIDRISRFLHIAPFVFIQEYLHRVGNQFSINERYTGCDYACVFLNRDNDQTCMIYPVRPDQCKQFPFWDYYKTRPHALIRECPGIRMHPENSLKPES